MSLGRENKPYAWGPRIGPCRPLRVVAGRGDAAPGLYPWPVWGPLPDWLPPGSRRLGLATGLAGVLIGAILGAGSPSVQLRRGWPAIGWGETSLLMIAGGFLGWQPIVVAGLFGLVPGLIAAMRQWMAGKSIAFSMWLALAVAGVWMGWYWIGPLVQGLFFNPGRLLLFVVLGLTALLAFIACLRLLAVARSSTGT